LGDTQNDPRLKLIEILVTLGGFLGVIVALEQQKSPNLLSQDSLSVFFVLLIVSTFLAYSSIVVKLEEKKIRLFILIFSGSFAGILTIVISVPLVDSMTQAEKLILNISNYEIVIFAVAFISITMIFFRAIYRATGKIMDLASEDKPTNNNVPE